MTKWLALALALLTQNPAPVKVVGSLSVPEGTIAKVNAKNATPPLKWSVYQLVPVSTMEAGHQFGFTGFRDRPYLVLLEAGNGQDVWRITFTPPNGPLPNPSPAPSPTPQPLPTPPQPLPDPDSGFIYPETNANGFTSAIGAAVRSTRAPVKQTAATAALYRLTAATIAADGTRVKPIHRTLNDAVELLKSNEARIVKDSKVRPMKEAFPEVSKLAAAQFGPAVEHLNEPLTPETRAEYVQFLNELAAGFEQARPQ